MNTDFLLGFGAGKAASGGGGSSVDVEPMSVTENGTYTAPAGKAYSPVTVNVPNSYAAADEGKVVSNGALVAQTSDTVTQNGTVDTTLINSLLVNVSGGGASNIVTGTFTGTTAGAAMDVMLNYSGTGYPIAALIFPTEGPRTNGSFANLVQRYAICLFCAVKQNVLVAPTYETYVGYNAMLMLHNYKSAEANAKQYANGGEASAYILKDEDAASGSGTYVRIRSAKKMSVFIADTSYGFAANIEYTYYVIYSE